MAQLATQMMDPFANSGDTKVAADRRGRLHVEPLSIVSHAELDVAFAERKIDADGPRLSMSNRIALGAALDNLVPNPSFGTIRTGDGLLTAADTRASQLLKPFPHYTGITRFRDSQGDAWYRGLTVRLERRSGKAPPAFGEPVSSLTDANFGRIITGGGQRRLQLGLRFQF